MFGSKETPVAVQLTHVMPQPVFVEFHGAMAEMDEETNTLRFTPRGPIWIQASNIGAYYDNTVILFGNKVRVMETAAQIALKIMEAMKDA